MKTWRIKLITRTGFFAGVTAVLLSALIIRSVVHKLRTADEQLQDLTTTQQLLVERTQWKTFLGLARQTQGDKRRGDEKYFDVYYAYQYPANFTESVFSGSHNAGVCNHPQACSHFLGFDEEHLPGMMFIEVSLYRSNSELEPKERIENTSLGGLSAQRYTWHSSTFEPKVYHRIYDVTKLTLKNATPANEPLPQDSTLSFRCHYVPSQAIDLVKICDEVAKTFSFDLHAFPQPLEGKGQ